MCILCCEEYFNCSCIVSSATDGQSDMAATPVAVAGACSGSSGFCTAAIVFVVAFFVAVLALCVCITTNMAATLRSLSPLKLQLNC